MKISEEEEKLRKKRRIEWYAKNKDTINKKRRFRYHNTSKEMENETSRIYKMKNRAKMSAYNLKWNRDNKERKKVSDARYMLWRRKLGFLSESIILEIIKRDKSVCQYCFVKCVKKIINIYNPKSLTIDHKVPASRKDEFKIKNIHAKSNLVVCCRRCNETKNTRTIEEHRRYLAKERKVIR